MISIAKISGFRSGVINALIDCVRMQRPVAGPGLLISESPGGTVISLGRRTDLPSTENITVITAWRLDKTNHKYQIKTRSVDVINPGSESGWTDISDSDGGTLDEGALP
jgi:hypothetical protein